MITFKNAGSGGNDFSTMFVRLARLVGEDGCIEINIEESGASTSIVLNTEQALFLADEINKIASPINNSSEQMTIGAL